MDEAANILVAEADEISSRRILPAEFILGKFNRNPIGKRYRTSYRQLITCRALNPIGALKVTWAADALRSERICLAFLFAIGRVLLVEVVTRLDYN